jgi:archaemetzincin
LAMEEKICLQPLGRADADVLGRIRHAVASEFGLLAESLAPFEVPSRAFSIERGQHYSTAMLTYLMRQVPEDALRVLGVTDVDLFVPRLNFVFGEATIEGRVGIISLHRLRPEFYGEIPDEHLFAERAVKEAVHELGHTFGLRHCSDSGCVMYFSKTIEDTDRKSRCFCPDHADRLAQRLRPLLAVAV